MAPKKKRAEAQDVHEESVDEEDEMDSNEDEIEEDNEYLGQTLQVEFEAVAPSADDYHGIQLLLQQKFSKLHVNVGHLAELIIKQEDVGCVLKQAESDGEEDEEDDDDDSTVIALFSAINLWKKKDEVSIKQFHTMINSKCQTAAPELAGNVMEIMHSEEDPVGFLISERFFGVPPRICVPSLRSLKQDMEKQVAAKQPFKFGHFLMLCQTLKEPRTGIIEYRFPEEKVFADASELTVTWSMAEHRDMVKMNGVNCEPCLTMLIFPSLKLEEIITNIETNKELLDRV